MELCVLGSGTGLPYARRNAPGLAVRAGPGSSYVLLDAGSGVLRRTAEAGIEVQRLADLFVIECSVPDARPRKGHLAPADVGRIGRDARARRLLLTHLSPEMDALDVVGAVAKHFAGDVVVAEDLMRIRL